MQRKTRVTYPMLRDEDNQVASQYGLRHGFPDELKALYQGFGVDLAHVNGEPSWTLPLPARFIIDPHGVIRDVDADPDYTIRPDPSETLDKLRSFM